MKKLLLPLLLLLVIPIAYGQSTTIPDQPKGIGSVSISLSNNWIDIALAALEIQIFELMQSMKDLETLIDSLDERIASLEIEEEEIVADIGMVESINPTNSIGIQLEGLWWDTQYKTIIVGSDLTSYCGDIFYTTNSSSYYWYNADCDLESGTYDFQASFYAGGMHQIFTVD